MLAFEEDSLKTTNSTPFFFHLLFIKNIQNEHMKYILSLVIGILCFQLSGQPEIEFENIASGFDRPLYLTHAFDDRMFVVEQDGRIYVIDENRDVLPTPFLDIDNIVRSTGNEQGLLGLAFHPNYQNNGIFIVSYTNNNGDSRISSFKVSNDDPNVADPNSETILLSVDQPYSNHNGGCIKFGPDGYLYIGFGDGGSAGDPDNNGQNRQTFLGKILRIKIANNGEAYGIPPNNPFAEDDFTLDEIWALGTRNPWRFSFDKMTGDLWIGDVGQNSWEEIDYQASTSTGGENYGWRCYEGLHTYNTTNCEDTIVMTDPVHEYSNTFSQGCAVTGGYVYRGNTYPNLDGWYFFTDYCTGYIWGLYPDGNGGFQYHTFMNAQDYDFASFGEDVNGELYILGLDSGIIYQIKDKCADFTASYITTNATCADSNDGFIELNIPESANVAWENGGNDTILENLGVGNYAVTISDEQDCSTSFDIEISATNASPESPSISVDHVLLSVLDTFATYQWYLNDTLIMDATQSYWSANDDGDYYVVVSNEFGCTNSSEVLPFVLQGTLEQLQLKSFNISPNPFSDEILIEMTSNRHNQYQLSILNIHGQVLLQESIDVNDFAQKSIDTSAFPAGIYQVVVQLGSNISSYKIVKQ